MDILLVAVIIVFTINWFHYLICLSQNSRLEGKWLLPGTWIGFVGLTVFVALEATHADTPLLDTQTGISLVFGWSIIGIYLFLLASFPLKIIGSSVLPTALLFIGIPHLPADLFQWGPWIHILLILMAYGTFTVSFFLAIGYLRAEHQLRSKSVDHTFFMFPSLETMDRGLQRSIWMGLGLLLTGILLGVLHGFLNDSIGIQWITDPNIMGAMLTAIIYGTIAYLRGRSLFTNRRIAYLSIMGFLLIVLLLFGMNFFPEMHQFL